MDGKSYDQLTQEMHEVSLMHRKSVQLLCLFSWWLRQVTQQLLFQVHYEVHGRESRRGRSRLLGALRVQVSGRPQHSQEEEPSCLLVKPTKSVTLQPNFASATRVILAAEEA